MAGWAGSARAAGRWATGGAPKPRAAYGKWARPTADRGVLNIMRQSGLRASTGGVLATKSECKMLASTCLYLLCAWLTDVGHPCNNIVADAIQGHEGAMLPARAWLLSSVRVAESVW